MQLYLGGWGLIISDLGGGGSPEKRFCFEFPAVPPSKPSNLDGFIDETIIAINSLLSDLKKNLPRQVRATFVTRGF